MIIIQSILRRRVVQNRYRNILALHRNNRIHHNRVFNEIRIRNREITEENNNHIVEINRRIQEIRENTIDRMNDIAMPRNDTPALSGLNQYMNNRGVTRAVNTSILDNMVLINRTSNNRHIDRLPNRVGNTVVNNNRQDLTNNRQELNNNRITGINNRTSTTNQRPIINDPINAVDNRHRTTAAELAMRPYRNNNITNTTYLRPVLENNTRDRERELNRIRNTISNITLSPMGNGGNEREVGRYNFRQFINRDGIPERYTCCICMDEHYICNVKLPCDHKVCTTCMREYISSCLGDMMNKIPIKCPMAHDNCNIIIDTSVDGIDKLLTKVDFDKLEKYTIMKTCIEDKYLKYCPNSLCGAPFDSTDISLLPEIDYKYKYCVKCFDCNEDFCINCNVKWHDGYTCEEYKQHLESNTTQNENYINKYCRECPNCKEMIQKQKSPEQEMYERRTGMNGGTYDCHHMECYKCKSQFCWTCMKIYGREYYHNTCPSGDCIIHFTNHSPIIQGMPPGKIDYIYMYILNNEMGGFNKRLLFSSINRNIVLSQNIKEDVNNVVRLYCTSDGIVQKLDHNIGEFTFRQEVKADFSKII
tara:strand:- start:271 stop:2037 length:1767 start_codon:yes stop_codon:yes gene_type:complete